jgi:RimJ/RimL family protein N-acetyltransferase
MRLNEVVLEGDVVRLEPLTEGHAAGIREAVADGELWNLHFTTVPHPDEVAGFIADARDGFARGQDLAFATIEIATGKVAGSTRFMNVRLADRRLEIGHTFLGKSWQRTRINTEAKLLMLAHAFETLGLNRVELVTDVINEVSRAAISRIGATQEGILRRHKIMRGGRVRDSAIYSIIADEWPDVKRDLTARLSG